MSENRRSFNRIAGERISIVEDVEGVTQTAFMQQLSG